MSTQPLAFVRPVPPEDEARANFYALLSRLFYAAADPALLEALAVADELEAQDATLADAWQQLCTAAAKADADAVREEYESAFVGVGKAPVTLYTGAYSVRYTNEVPLARLRGELAAFGLARRGEAAEPEDHIAALCDVMRHLVRERSLAEQKHFFEAWISPIVEPLCAAIQKSEHTRFYRRVAELAKAFFALEQTAFEML